MATPRRVVMKVMDLESPGAHGDAAGTTGDDGSRRRRGCRADRPWLRADAARSVALTAPQRRPMPSAAGASGASGAPTAASAAKGAPPVSVWWGMSDNFLAQPQAFFG